MIRPTKFEITQTGERPAVALAISGELDIRTISVVSEHVDEQLAAGISDLTLDLRRLTFLDSSGLRLLIGLHDRSRQAGWRLRLIAPEEEAATLVLRATGADSALPFAEGSAER
jgi:anti-sigma B factor antagonist